jgi:hypothetical protein
MDKKRIEIIIAGILILVFIMILSGSRRGILRISPAAQQAQKEVAGVADKFRPLFETKAEEKLETGAGGMQVSDRDPFSLPSSSSPAPSAASDLELNGITTKADGKLMALINGEILPVGGKVSGFKVISITKDKVELSNGTETRVLKMER